MIQAIEDTMCKSDFKFIGFYYNDKNTPIDNYCKCAFLGNFYYSKFIYKEKEFQNAEAAFQACKWWDYVDEFTKCTTGNQAYNLKQHYSKKIITQDYDYNIMNFNTDMFINHNLQAMYEILLIKFTDPVLKQQLNDTKDYLLIEHNETPNRDKIWSNNYDGSGSNALGLLLMIIRHKNRTSTTSSQNKFYNKLIQILKKMTGGKPPQPDQLYESEDINIKYWKAIVLVGTYLIKDTLHVHTPIGNITGNYNQNIKLYGGLTYYNINSNAKALIESLLGNVNIQFIQSYNKNTIIRIVFTKPLDKDDIILSKPYGYEFHKSYIEIYNS